MKRIIGIILAAVLVVGLGAFFVVRSAEDKVTADMLSRAGRFAIPANWKLTDEIVRPEQFLCISTNPCPSLYRQWDTGKELTENDVTAVVSGVGFEMKTDRPCQRQSNAIGVATICSSSGTDGDYNYMLNVASPDPNEPQTVTLIVRPVD
ncbi:hypothetical protein [Arthrobacter sp. ISL-69]|uniref:hypothetical protein n=1 Tax=Arthrobacter sp. ISL-69 TaxID=2819113 RepID=UPI001BED3A43|nr:hypothetical protein [Arthrobacter sp. ISL-69]MBT2535435.1 hypothetical protein [Arthrobacter sp. ISL-69]